MAQADPYRSEYILLVISAHSLCINGLGSVKDRQKRGETYEISILEGLLNAAF
jgi:hypothetical protein